MSTEQVWASIAIAVITGLSGWLAVLTNRRGDQAQTDATKFVKNREADIKSRETDIRDWQALVSEMRTEMARQRTENQALRERIDQQDRKLSQQDEKNEQQDEKITELQNELRRERMRARTETALVQVCVQYIHELHARIDPAIRPPIPSMIRDRLLGEPT